MTSAAGLSRRALIAIAAAGMIVALTLGLRSLFGLFLEPMSAEYGWGREIFALAIAIQNLVWGLAQPAAGAVADRYGAGRVLVAGGLLYAAGIYFMSTASDPLTLHLFGGVMIGLGMSGASMAVCLAAVARMVSESRRSFVFGLVTAAGSAGQFVLAPLGQAFIEGYGWPAALVFLALICLLIVPSAAGLTGTPPQDASGVRQSMAQALRQALSHSGYRYLTAGFFVCGFHVTFIAIHLPAYLKDSADIAYIAGWALALIGLFNIFGSFISGLLGGRFRKKYLLSWLYLARAIVIALFMLAPVSEASVLIFSAALGLLWLSTVPLTAGLVAEIFGLRYSGTLFGIVFLSHQLGSFLGVWLGGYMFDLLGSYDAVWWLSVALGLAAAWLHWPIDDRAVQPAAAQTETAH